MFYKPKYCCNCSEKIERTVWNLKTSRRFCQLCETEFVPHEWIPRIIVIFGIISLVVGFATYFQKSEKPLKIAASVIPENAPQLKKEPLNQPSAIPMEAKSNVQNAVNLTKQSQKQSSAPQTFLQNAQPNATENQLNSDERVYFCGAATKKGTPCSRRVKGGGRCWQHTGQPAILPTEKLIASR